MASMKHDNAVFVLDDETSHTPKLQNYTKNGDAAHKLNKSISAKKYFTSRRNKLGMKRIGLCFPAGNLTWFKQYFIDNRFHVILYTVT